MGRKGGHRPHGACILKRAIDTEGTRKSTRLALGEGQPRGCGSLEVAPHPAQGTPANLACSSYTLTGVACSGPE